MVSMQVSLTDSKGKVLFQNPAYLFHDQYEISADLPSFFEEDSRLSSPVSRFRAYPGRQYSGGV